MILNNQSRVALIIFVRNPVLGKVKTRLAKGIGNDKALEVYEMLLKHTLEITKELPCAKFVYYADEVNEQDLWPSEVFIKRSQYGNDLGDRMRNSFKELLEQGYEKALIIGSDNYKLNSRHLLKAINALQDTDVIIGPTFDGGYYLLGMKNLIPELFINKDWSTEKVIHQTISDLQNGNYSYKLLQKLHDVDNAEDLEINGIII